MADAATLAALIRIRGLEESVRDMKRFQGQMQKSETQTKKFAGASKQLVGVLGGLGVALGAAGLLRGLGGFIKTAAVFEQSMAKVEAISGATAEEFERLTAIAREMGRTTQFTASQSADALVFLSQAGFEATESIAALPGVLNLAAAAGIDLARSADIASNVLTGFGLQVSQLSRVNDVLTATFTSTNTNLEQLAGAMKFVGPVANTVGLELEEVSAILGQMANAGVQGTMAGRSLRMALIRLINPPKEAQDVLDRLGVTVLDTSGNMRSMTDILGDLADAHLGTRDAAKLWGTESVTAMSAVMSQGVPALEALIEKLIEQRGITQDIVDIQTDTVTVAVKEWASAWESLQLTTAKSNGLIRDFIEGQTRVLRGMERVIGKTEDLTAVRDKYLGTFAEEQDLAGMSVEGLETLNEIYAKRLQSQLDQGTSIEDLGKLELGLIAIRSALKDKTEELSKATGDLSDMIDIATVKGQDWIARFGGPASEFANEFAKAQREAAMRQHDFNEALLAGARAADAYTKAQARGDKLLKQFNEDQEDAANQAGNLINAIKSISQGLDEEFFFLNLVASIQRDMASGALSAADAVIALQFGVTLVNEALSDNQKELKAAAAGYAKLQRQIEAAAMAQAQFAGGFAGRAPAGLTAEATRGGDTGIDARAKTIYNAFSAQQKEALRRDRGVGDIGSFQTHFFTLIKGLMAGGLDRAAAELRVQQQLPGFAHGGTSPGGPILVGENGPEIVAPPRGSQIFANGSGGGMTVIINNDFSGAIVGMDEVDDRIAAGVQDGLRQAGGRGRGR